MSLSFTTQNDELPVGRPKINHAQGVVGLVSWIDRGGHDYTGLFDGGSDLGLIWMSESNFMVGWAGGLTPSLAIKFVMEWDPSITSQMSTSNPPVASTSLQTTSVAESTSSETSVQSTRSKESFWMWLTRPNQWVLPSFLDSTQTAPKLGTSTFPLTCGLFPTPVMQTYGPTLAR